MGIAFPGATWASHTQTGLFPERWKGACSYDTFQFSDYSSHASCPLEFIAARNASAESPSPSLAGNQKPSSDSSLRRLSIRQFSWLQVIVPLRLPKVSPSDVTPCPQGTRQIHSLIQWRDRTGISPDFLIKSKA